MAEIKSGGQIQTMCNNAKILKSISFYAEHEKRINLLLNDDSLSYITIEEAIDIRNELNEAIKKATGV